MNSKVYTVVLNLLSKTIMLFVFNILARSERVDCNLFPDI